MSKWLLAGLPLGVLGIVAILFAAAIWDGPNARKSPLIGRPAPAFDLPAVPGLDVPGLKRADLGRGHATIVNFWASWCVPCRIEHPALVVLARASGIELVAINYKDTPDQAAAFITELGNPFARIGADREGRVGIDWGVSGVPETFYVGPDGRILAHANGPLDEQTVLRWAQGRL